MIRSSFRFVLLIVALTPSLVMSETVWIEGEKPTKSIATRHPWYDGQVKRELLSGGDFLSHWDSPKMGEHGMLDCFVFTTEPFTPQGTLKPGEAAK